MVTTLAGTAGRKGSTDGVGAAARFNLPNSIAVDVNGVVYVADTFNHTSRKITPVGSVTTLAGTAGRKGSTDGLGTTAFFNSPAGVVVDAQGMVYVTDHMNATVRRITPVGEVTTLAGTALGFGHTDGIGQAARFKSISGIAADAQGTLYVTDGCCLRIIK